MKSPRVKEPIPCLPSSLFRGTEVPIIGNPHHQAQNAHSFKPTSRNGRTMRTVISFSDFGFHSSFASSATENPAPCAIPDIRLMERDVSEVPRIRCDERREAAVCRSKRRMSVCVALYNAVWVGREDRYVRRAFIGE